MRVRILLATSALAICSALAQQEPPASHKPQRESNPPSSTAQPREATTDKTQAATNASSATSEMKPQTYKGVLVDASCAMPQGDAAMPRSQASPAAITPGAAGAGTAPSTSAAAPSTADRAASEQACPVSSSTNQFALKLQDGRTMRFDSVGNDRAQEALKNKKKWSEAASSGKTINAKVKGVMVGPKLIVSSIN